MYRILIENRVKREIKRFPNEILRKIISTIEELKLDPRPAGVKKLIEKDGWRIRIGNYRILYTIDDKNKVVTVYRIRHRKEVYLDY